MESKIFSFGSVSIDPDCLSIDSSLSLKSSVALNNGQSIPTYISYSSDTHDFKILNPPEVQTLITHNIIVSFKVMKGTSVKFS